MSIKLKIRGRLAEEVDEWIGRMACSAETDPARARGLAALDHWKFAWWNGTPSGTLLVFNDGCSTGRPAVQAVISALDWMADSCGAEELTKAQKRSAAKLLAELRRQADHFFLPPNE